MNGRVAWRLPHRVPSGARKPHPKGRREAAFQASSRSGVESLAPLRRLGAKTGSGICVALAKARAKGVKTVNGLPAWVRTASGSCSRLVRCWTSRRPCNRESRRDLGIIRSFPRLRHDPGMDLGRIDLPGKGEDRADTRTPPEEQIGTASAQTFRQPFEAMMQPPLPGGTGFPPARSLIVEHEDRQYEAMNLGRRTQRRMIADPKVAPIPHDGGTGRRTHTWSSRQFAAPWSTPRIWA